MMNIQNMIIIYQCDQTTVQYIYIYINCDITLLYKSTTMENIWTIAFNKEDCSGSSIVTFENPMLTSVFVVGT